MKTVLVLALSLLISSVGRSDTEMALKPSAKNCEFYQQIEAQMQCGPDGYFQKWAAPMCEKYIRSQANPITSLFLSSELKQWFPKVRLCLQQYLLSEASHLSCENLDEHANQSHVECYVETGYCELSTYAKLQLAGLSANAVFMDPVLWQQSALEISKICAGFGRP